MAQSKRLKFKQYKIIVLRSHAFSQLFELRKKRMMLNLTTLLGKIWHEYTYENADPRIRDRLLMGSPVEILLLTLCQLVVLRTVNKFMSVRKNGFKLSKLLLVVNCYIFVLNLYFFIEAARLGWLSGYSWTCEPIDRSNSDKMMEIVQKIHYFLIFKMTYFIEVLVFELMKNERRASFFCYFHHLTLPIMIWIMINYQPGGHFTFIGFINTFDHVILFGTLIIVSIFPSSRGKWYKHTIFYGQVSSESLCR